MLPCLDEAEALPWVLDRFPSGHRPVLADNASRDGSADLARARGVLVVDVPRRGYGAAVHAGLLACTAEVVAVMDADGSLDPLDLPAVTGPVAGGLADLCVGRRRPTGRGAWPVHARWGNAVLAARLRRTSGLALHDLGPVRSARREALLALGVRDRRSGWPLEELLRAGAAGWRVAEVDVAYAPRRGGRSKVSGSVRGTVRALRDMSRVLVGTVSS